MNRRDVFYNLERRVTPTRLLNSIAQSFNNPMNDGKTLVLVEGYGDYRYYKKMLIEKSVFIQSTSGCDNMNAILPILVKQQKCLAIQDSDFLKMGQHKIVSANMLYTDYHDYEMSALADDDFRKRYLEVLKDNGCDVDINIALTELYTLSYYKLCNELHNFRTVFEPVNKLICKVEKLDYNMIHGHIGSNSNGFHDITFGFLNGIIRSCPIDEDKKEYHLVNGHDLFNRLCFHSVGVVDEDFLRDKLLELSELSDFMKMNLYTLIVDWQNQNSVSIVLS